MVRLLPVHREDPRPGRATLRRRGGTGSGRDPSPRGPGRAGLAQAAVLQGPAGVRAAVSDRRQPADRRPKAPRPRRGQGQRRADHVGAGGRPPVGGPRPGTPEGDDRADAASAGMPPCRHHRDRSGGPAAGSRRPEALRTDPGTNDRAAPQRRTQLAGLPGFRLAIPGLATTARRASDRDRRGTPQGIPVPLRSADPPAGDPNDRPPRGAEGARRAQQGPDAVRPVGRPLLGRQGQRRPRRFDGRPGAGRLSGRAGGQAVLVEAGPALARAAGRGRLRRLSVREAHSPRSEDDFKALQLQRLAVWGKQAKISIDLPKPPPYKPAWAEGG